MSDISRKNGQGRSESQRLDEGMAVRRAVLGDAHVDAAQANATDFTSEFQEFISRVAWGDVWTRPGLERRMRSAVVLSSTLTAGNWEEFALHARAALRNGLTAAEIKEILLQLAVYAGVPRANHGFKIANEIMRAEGKL